MIHLLAVFLFLSSGLKAEEVFLGENCQKCHSAIRGRTVQANKINKLNHGQYDVVVVGGGLAGLSAGYFLRDNHILILEKESKAGGHLRRDSWKNLSYPTAADYSGKPEGIIAEMFEDLGIRAQKIPPPTDLYMINGKIIEDFWGAGVDQLSYPPAVKENFRRLAADIKRLNDEEIFSVPVRDSKTEALVFDKISFWDYLEKNYGVEVATHGDQFARDMFGAGAREVSAFVGLMYLAGEAEQYSWSNLGEALEKRLGSRIRTAALVTQVEEDINGVWVTYIADGEALKVFAQTAVLATPSHVTKKILKPLSDEKEKALDRVRFSAYAVAAVAFKKPLPIKAYGLWPDKNSLFSSVTFPDWIERAGGKKSASGAQIVNFYIPMGAEDGRLRLSNLSDKKFKSEILKEIEKLFSGYKNQVEEIRVIRWGHAMPIMEPGYMNEVRPRLEKPSGHVFFASQDTEIPAMEGAVHSAYRASHEVRQFLESLSPTK